VTFRSSGKISHLNPIEERILFLLLRCLIQEKEQVLPHVRSLRKEKLDLDAEFLK
jgi:hypothetical protein